MSPAKDRWCWVFTSAGASFPGGVFTTEQSARSIIVRHSLSGVLTQYPLDDLSFDWATANGYFKPPRSGRAVDATLIGSHVSERQVHIHFEDGQET